MPNRGPSDDIRSCRGDVRGTGTTVTSNFSGNYRCEPQPVSCSSGQTFSVTQSGDTLRLKSDKGEQGDARLTSDTTISAGPPWNMLEVAHNGAIEWSNGTKWRKQ